MSFEGTLREEFMAGRQVGLRQGLELIQKTLGVVYTANQNKSLPPEIVLAVIQDCLDLLEKKNPASS